MGFVLTIIHWGEGARAGWSVCGCLWVVVVVVVIIKDTDKCEIVLPNVLQKIYDTRMGWASENIWHKQLEVGRIIEESYPLIWLFTKSFVYHLI